MKTKLQIFIVLLSLISTATFAQYRYSKLDKDAGELNSYLKIGTQAPLQHSIVYDHRITPGFSLNAGLGFITAPYTGMIFSGLENKGMISANEREVLDRSFQLGISYQLGANFHFNKNYIRMFGQLTNLNGDLSITDLANLTFNTNIPNIGKFLSPIDVRSNVPMVGLLYGRKFAISPNSEIHLEGSLSKTLGHNTTYKTGTLIDNFGLINDVVYSQIDNDLDSYFKNKGWFPTLNVYYVFKF